MPGTVYGEKYSIAALADMNGYGQTNCKLSDYADVSATNIILPDDFVTTLGKGGSESFEPLIEHTLTVTVTSSGRFADNWYNDTQNFVWSLSAEYHCTVQVNAGANIRTKLVEVTLVEPYTSGTFNLRCYFYYNVYTFLDITDYIQWSCTVNEA